MRIKVDSQHTLNAIVAICGAAGKTGDLGAMKTAVVIAEALEVEDGPSETTGDKREPEEETEEPKPEIKSFDSGAKKPKPSTTKGN